LTEHAIVLNLQSSLFSVQLKKQQWQELTSSMITRTRERLLNTRLVSALLSGLKRGYSIAGVKLGAVVSGLPLIEFE